VGNSYREMRAGLVQQLSGLTRNRRKAVSRLANQAITKLQGLKNAGDHLVPQPLQQKGAGRPSPIERYRKQMQSWPPETPPCPVCRMRIGLPKRSWPNREMADHVRERQNDARLAVYSCPAGYGWHLGHRPDASSAATGHPATTAQPQNPYRADTVHAPISSNSTQEESSMKMNATLGNPLLIAVYSAALLLIGCAVGMHWAHTPATAIRLAIAGGLLMAGHDTAMGILWFWLTARWARCVIERNHRG
jgi:hypothetical protein